MANLVLPPETRRSFWSRQADTYHKMWNSDLNGERAWYKRLEAELLMELGRIDTTSRVLDLCCGCGRNTLAIARQAAQAIGIDAAQGMIAMARQDAQNLGLNNVLFVCGDSRRLPFANNYFDAVVGTRFMYMLNPVEKRAVILEAQRVVRPGGRIVLQFNNGFWGMKEELLLWLRGKFRPVRDRYLWPGQATRLFQGLNLVAIHGVALFRLGLVSRMVGERTARRINSVVRYPISRWCSSNLLVAAEKPLDS